MFHRHSWCLQVVYSDFIYPTPKKGNLFTKKSSWVCNCGASKAVVLKEQPNG